MLLSLPALLLLLVLCTRGLPGQSGEGVGQEHTLSSCARSKVADFGVNDGDACCVPGVGLAAQPKGTQVSVS